MTRRTWLLFACPLVTACASGAQPAAPPAPAATPFHIEGAIRGLGTTRILNDPRTDVRTIAAPVDQVWRILPAVYEALGIEGAGTDEEAKAVGKLGFHPRRVEGRPLSTYLNCGMGITAVPKADEYDVTMSAVTQVKLGADGRTLLATTVHASAKPRTESGNAVYCDSRGTFEARVFELVVRASDGPR